MSILVSTNRETINNIESNIEFTVNNTQQANKELVKANKYQKKIRNIEYILYFFVCYY
jgi:t-SNARE complex subunit (syntaxin)